MKHLRLLRALFMSAVLPGACTDPGDTLFTPTVVEPVEVEPGLFRVTFNEGYDVARGFTPDGSRILYRSRGLSGFGDEWRILTMPIGGGQVREEAALYRITILDSPGAIVHVAGGRIFVGWKAPADNIQFCGGCPEAPIVWAFSLIRLPVEDGAPLSSLVSTVVHTPFAPDTNDFDLRLRYTPVTQELTSWSINPFGPVVSPTGSEAYYSNGESIWRIPISLDSGPDSITPGAFPAISVDGTLLAAAVPIGLDSTSTFCTFGQLRPCTQEMVMVTSPGWESVVWNLETGAEILRVSGVEPQFDPAGGRILVRRPDGLHWVRLDSAADELIPGTGGAMAPFISPDGSSILFSRFESPGLDVFLLRLR